jgi:WD40 repeat protein
VWLVGAGDTADVANVIGQAFRSAGFQIVAPPSPADCAVVLLSPGGASQLPKEDKGFPDRIVPVLVLPVLMSELPKFVSQVQYFQWVPNNVNQSLGRIFAAVRTSGGDWQLVRRLRNAALRWATLGRPADSLVQDEKELREYQGALRATAGRGEVEEGHVLAFLRQSERAVRARKRRSLRRRVLLLTAVVGGVLSALLAIPSIKQGGRENRELLATAESPLLQALLPGWTSLLDGALIRDGDAAQGSAALSSILPLLARPWSDGEIHLGAGYSVEDVAVLPGGTEAAVIIGTNDGDYQFAFYDIPSGRVVWRIRTGGTFFSLGASPDGRFVAVAGRTGLVYIDLAAHRLASFASARLLPSATIVLNSGTALVGAPDGSVSSFSPSSPHVERTVSAGGSLVALSVAPDGSGRALVYGDGSYRLFNVGTATTVWAGRVPAPILAAGAVAGDGSTGYVLAGDHQIWELRPSGPPKPLGIPASDRDTALLALPGGRLAVGGDSDFVQAYEISDGLDLGRICTDVPQLSYLRDDTDGSTIACAGPVLNTFWPAPPGVLAPQPFTTAVPRPRDASATAGISVLVKGSTFRLEKQEKGETLSTGWIAWDLSAITTVSLDPTNTEVALGTAEGEVTVASLAGDDVTNLVDVELPSPSVVTNLVWGGDRLVAIDSAGAWEVPGCLRCTSAGATLAELEQRLSTSGCWTPTQLEYVSARARSALQAPLCTGLPAPSGD